MPPASDWQAVVPSWHQDVFFSGRLGRLSAKRQSTSRPRRRGDCFLRHCWRYASRFSIGVMALLHGVTLAGEWRRKSMLIQLSVLGASSPKEK